MPALRERLRTLWDTLTAAPTSPGAGGRRDDTQATAGGPRAAGPPRSQNGASSFHLIWQMPRTGAAARLVEVSAVLEILVPPRVQALYFWALQVDFLEDGRMWGGGHTGLQWNRRFPGGTAVNWGGYASQERGGAVLPGTDPDLSFFPGDPNTMAFPWRPEQAYRLRVSRSPEVPGAWRADLTDMTSGETTVLRDLLYPQGSGRHRGRDASGGGTGHLAQPIVWSEVFADCDAPSVVVRWSDLSAKSEDGAVVRPEAVGVNYQTHQAGGCANTSVKMDGTGLLQITNTPREVSQGSRVPFGAE
jgi:hypothetical protein